MPTREPVSRRSRPAKPELSRRAVVDTAIRVMGSEGLERVTMRRLAGALDTGPSSLYVYFDNLAELHGAVLDELIAELPLSAPPAAGDWRGPVVEVLVAYTGLLFRHPGLARSALTLRPHGPNALRLLETLLAHLRRGGIPERQAAWGVDLLLQQATATAAEQSTRDASPDVRIQDRALRAAVEEIDGATHPELAAHREELLSGRGEERLRWAFAVLLAGISSAPAPGDPVGVQRSENDAAGSEGQAS